MPSIDEPQLAVLDPEPEREPGLEPAIVTPAPRVVPRRIPPPLPPRGPSHHQLPPSYIVSSGNRDKFVSQDWNAHDPRSSSTQSLVPSESTKNGRRTLLLIYIHGFMGNEASFQSFPAHVHHLLTMTMSDTHVVHTKLYPRYKSRRAIEYARDDFSNWLEPHEAPSTDVVLLGHSMGGILGVEVALIPGEISETVQALRHRILGTVSFDTPFLGMHPGLVVSGISSLFRTAPVQAGATQESPAPSASNTTSPTSSSQVSIPMSPGLLSTNNEGEYLTPIQSSSSSMYSLPTKDPHYDPPFPNDVHMPQRTGWNKVWHFVSKHSDGLTTATKQYFMSHLEFGGCLADYPGLKNRYSKIRALEDVDDVSQPRVRFLNYYTASTGIPKKSKNSPGTTVNDEGEIVGREGSVPNSESDAISSVPTRETSFEESNEGFSKPYGVPQDNSPIKTQMQNLGEASGVQESEMDEPLVIQHIDSMPIEEDDDLQAPYSSTTISSRDEELVLDDAEIIKRQTETALPPIPSLPEEPQPIDLSVFTDKDESKIAEKEQKRLLKVYQQAIKDRDNAIKDRRKLVEKREKKARQDYEKRLKEEQKQRLKEEKEVEKRQTGNQTSQVEEKNPAENLENPENSEKPDKPKRDKRFCLLPSDINGTRDSCWVRVYMEGVDEVGAHCGLFFPGPQYETLVGDVAARIEQWVKDDTIRGAAQAEVHP